MVLMVLLVILFIYIYVECVVVLIFQCINVVGNVFGCMDVVLYQWTDGIHIVIEPVPLLK